MRGFMNSFGALLVFTLIGCAVLTGYSFRGRFPPQFMFQLWDNVFWLSVVSWIQTDARLRRQTPCFDFGWLVWLTAWIAIPWYVVRTRGWRGLFVLLMFLVLYSLPPYLAMQVWIVLHISPPG